MEERKKKRKKKRKSKKTIFVNAPTDIDIFFIVLFLVCVGIIMVYSSSIYSGGKGVTPWMKHAIFSAVGMVIMYIISRIRIEFINNFMGYIYFISVVLLIAVLIDGIGKEVKGAMRWIPIGNRFNLQPSEVAKIVLIVYMAHLLSKYKKIIETPQFLVRIAIYTVLPVILVAKEDFSSAAVILAIVGVMVFVTYKFNLKVVIGGSGIIGVILGYFLMVPYRRARLVSFGNPWLDPDNSGMQIIQSMYAIGSGGFFGKGLGKSVQKQGYLFEAHNDIIFAVISEELGLFGALAILGLYVLLIYRMMRIAFQTQNRNYFLIMVGIISHISIQVIINIGVATSLLPATGIPLPFISYGGSSMMIFLMEIGFVLNIARRNRMESLRNR